MVPAPLKDSPEVVAETEAVGVPPATFNTENLALDVAIEPINRSCVVLASKTDPLPEFQGPDPHDPQVGALAPERRH